MKEKSTGIYQQGSFTIEVPLFKASTEKGYVSTNRTYDGICGNCLREVYKPVIRRVNVPGYGEIAASFCPWEGVLFSVLVDDRFSNAEVSEIIKLIQGGWSETARR